MDGLVLPDEATTNLLRELTQLLQFGLRLDLLGGNAKTACQSTQKVFVCDQSTTPSSLRRAMDVAVQTATRLTSSRIEELIQPIEWRVLREIALAQRQEVFVGTLIAHRVVGRKLLHIQLKGLTQTISFQGLEHVLICAERQGFTALDRLAIGRRGHMTQTLYPLTIELHEEAFQDLTPRSTWDLDTTNITYI